MTMALIMAGGRGDRMRASGAPVPKPLIPIRGVPLLERNLLRLFYSGFLNVVVAVPSHSPKVASFVRSRGQALAEAMGAQLRLFEETQPLGNIGAAADLETGGNDLLVVFADNLTSLDLKALVRHHCESHSALTAAVHLEPFRVPYGEVQVRDGMIAAYHEKPEHRILISSGLFVLAPNATAHLPRSQRAEVSWLVNRLLAERAKVTAFLHDAPWIDVNDSPTIERAEHLVARHPDAFECREPAPDRIVVSAVLYSSDQLILEHRPQNSGRYPNCWDLPGTLLESGQSAESALQQELWNGLGVELTVDKTPCVFDDVDPLSRQVYRHVVFTVNLGNQELSPRPDRPLRSITWRGLDRAGPLGPAVGRALAAANPFENPPF